MSAEARIIRGRVLSFIDDPAVSGSRSHSLIDDGALLVAGGLIEAVGERYRRSDRNEKRAILDEFIELTGYHRKHAIRVLCCAGSRSRQSRNPVLRGTTTTRCAPR